MGFDNVNVNVSGPVQPTSTYKTKVLKGNHSFASQVTEPNMKYVIKHNFVLDSDVTIPANCILEFNGGSIGGAYTLTGNSTGINAGLVKIFNTDITLAGSWNVAEAYPEWFGAKNDGVTDDTNSIKKAISITNNKIVFVSGTYLFVGTITIPNGICLIGSNNTTLIYHATAIGESGLNLQSNVKLNNISIDATFNSVKERTVNYANTNTVLCNDVGNVLIENVSIEGGHFAINITDCNNITVRNCNIQNIASAGVYLHHSHNIKVLNNTVKDAGYDCIKSSGESYNVTIDRNHCSYANRDGIDVYDGFISSVLSNNICVNNTLNGIDLKGTPNSDGKWVVRDISVSDCICQGNKNGISITNIRNAVVSNIQCIDNNEKGITSNTAQQVMFNNCSCRHNKQDGFYFQNAHRLIYMNNCSAIDNYFDTITEGVYYNGITIESGVQIFIIGGQFCVGNDNNEMGNQSYGIYNNGSILLLEGVTARANKVAQLGEGTSSVINKGTNFIGNFEQSVQLISLTTSQRNSLSLTTTNKGYSIFDTTLGKPIYWNGTAWVDATGTLV